MNADKKQRILEKLTEILDATSEDTYEREMTIAKTEGMEHLAKKSQEVLQSLVIVVAYDHWVNLASYAHVHEPPAEIENPERYSDKIGDAVEKMSKDVEMKPDDIESLGFSYNQIGGEPYEWNEILYRNLMMYTHGLARLVSDLLQKLEIPPVDPEEFRGAPD